MNRHNLPPGMDSHEASVSPSKSFADFSRRDVEIQQKGKLVRIISYPTPSGELIRLRKSLDDRNLVLGEKIQSRNKTMENFIIPDLARPISRDKRIHKSGPYNYEDPQLFYYLGRLLGQVAQEGPELPIVLDDTISSNVAVAVPPHHRLQLGEPAILLVPGFERKVSTIEDDDALLDFYSDNLHDEFGPRFEESEERFAEGFRTTLGG